MFAIIVNSASGGHANEALTRSLIDLIEKKGHTARVFATAHEGDAAADVCQALAQGYTSIVGVGGDGTLSEIVGSMGGTDATLYIVPSGTGNDFARSLCLPKDPVEAFRRQLEGEPHAYDCLTINGKPFLNIGGSGFDVEVLRKTEELKAVYPGEKAYTQAVLHTLTKYEPCELELTIDDGEPVRERCTIVAIANGRFYGGGMLVAPKARVDDGLMDVIVLGPVPRWGIPFLLPLFVKGVHAHVPFCRMVKAKRAVLRGKGMFVNIDGDLVQMDVADFGVISGGLKMMKPVKA